ncbi:MAG: hypothetical protein M3442_13525 [Chloroflexota bacterium]|nr:hypothetical protein [Chloroflexota bacterium]
MALQEHVLVRETFGLSDTELAALARTSALVSGAPRPVVTRIVAEIDDWLAHG